MRSTPPSSPPSVSASAGQGPGRGAGAGGREPEPGQGQGTGPGPGQRQRQGPAPAQVLTLRLPPRHRLQNQDHRAGGEEDQAADLVSAHLPGAAAPLAARSVGARLGSGLVEGLCESVPAQPGAGCWRLSGQETGAPFSCANVCFRDTAGQERFRTITTAYYRGAMVRAVRAWTTT